MQAFRITLQTQVIFLLLNKQYLRNEILAKKKFFCIKSHILIKFMIKFKSVIRYDREMRYFCSSGVGNSLFYVSTNLTDIKQFLHKILYIKLLHEYFGIVNFNKITEFIKAGIKQSRSRSQKTYLT